MWLLLFGVAAARGAEFNTSFVLEVGGNSPMIGQGGPGYRTNRTTGLLDKHAFDKDATLLSTFVGTGFTLVGSLYRARWVSDNNQPLARTSSPTDDATSDTLQNNESTEATMVSISGLDLTFHNFSTVVGATANSTLRALQFEVPVLTQA